jgi:hypothetical protein
MIEKKGLRRYGKVKSVKTNGLREEIGEEYENKEDELKIDS